MLIRRSTEISRSGERRTYVSLAHNVRERLPSGESRPKPIIFARLGREDALDANTVKQMLSALDRDYRDRFGEEPPESEALSEAASNARRAAPALRMLASRAYGMRVVAEHAWKELGLDCALKAVQRQQGATFPFEGVVA